jgi:muramoyltetrapeptide carboxypeptidase
MPASIKPPRLRPGDTVGIVSPAWGGAGVHPHRLQRGVAHLRSMGYDVKIGDHARNQRGPVSDTAANRVADLHAMFRNPDVRLILATIGGDHACHLLPLLDFDLIRAHPTSFMGFSDITVLNVAIWRQTGVVTCNGPALLTDFAEYPRMFDYTEHSFLRTVGRAEPPGVIAPSDWWTEEFLDWGTKSDLERPRRRETAEGWHWLHSGHAEGPLIGGCLESLEHLRGTPYWPAFDGAILFLETSEDAPSPARVDAMLMDYENMGVLARIAGLLVGRPMRYTPEQRRELRDVVLERTRAFGFPVVTDMDFGHTSPMFVLPLGCRARIDADQRTFAIVEAAVS